MRVFLFLQVIALIIFVYTMYFLPSNLYFISIVSVFVIVNTVGLTYYVFRTWWKEIRNSGQLTKVFYFTLLVTAIVAVLFLFSNIFRMWVYRYTEDSLVNFSNSLLAISTFLLVSFGVSYLTLKRELEKQIQEYEKLRTVQQRLSIQVVRYKTNPHFLFNSLSTAISMLDLRVEREKIREYLSNLAELFRVVLNAPEVWTLKDELELAKRYLEIQKVRVEGLEYEITMGPACETVRIPSLVLQPIVENSIVHGIAKSKNGGKIKLECTKVNGTVTIKVSDNGKGGEKIIPGMGLKLVQELMNAFSRKVELHFESSPESGTIVTLSWEDIG